ncbi:uncharacterized protein J3R85_018079 [Psidium guajava]|nr:uncharacterized protein J3R85_018079 [Psidium guajava]
MAVQDMEVSDTSVTNGNANTSSTTTSSLQSLSPTSSSSPPPPPPPPPPPVIISPCAACKILRRRCAVEKCVLAPYFPPTEPAKFTIAHRVFGASNIIKLLQVRYHIPFSFFFFLGSDVGDHIIITFVWIYSNRFFTIRSYRSISVCGITLASVRQWESNERDKSVSMPCGD